MNCRFVPFCNSEVIDYHRYACKLQRANDKIKKPISTFLKCTRKIKISNFIENFDRMVAKSNKIDDNLIEWF